jgi:integrase
MKARPPVEFEMEDESNPSRIKFSKDSGERVVPRRRVRLLFTTAIGTPITSPTWSRHWATAVEKVGLPKGFGVHDLRHLFATSLIHHGASVKTVQLALGHKSAQTTFETYIHEWPDLLDRTRSIMERVLSAEPAEREAAAGSTEAN